MALPSRAKEAGGERIGAVYVIGRLVHLRFRRCRLHVVFSTER